MENKKIVVMSVLIALVALVILILSLLFVMSSQPATRAKIENIILPLESSGNKYDTQNIIRVNDGAGGEEDDESPVISGLPDMTLAFEETKTLPHSLDYYASDDEDSHSDLTFTIIYTTTISPAPLNISINSSTHILTIKESNGVWTGTETVTIRVKDTDGNTDEDSFTVTINNGSSGPLSPNVAGIPDITFAEDGSDNSIDLDNYVTDPDNTDSQMTWTYTGNTNVLISIDGSSHIVTFTASPNWNGTETIKFKATDPNENYGEDTITVTVTPVDDPAVWMSLSDQTINEDSAVGTIVYANIASRVSDVDGPVVIVVSSNINFNVAVAGNDLVLTFLKANWYGSETITLSGNGITASFTLNVNKLMDDCITICSYGKCYTYCD